MPNIINSLSNRGISTPDLKDIRRKEFVLLFVYDNFKTTEKDGKYLLKHGKYLGRAKTALSSFYMRSYSDDFPLVFEDQNSQSYRRGYIQGEVFAVTPEMIVLMDDIMSNGISKVRKRRNFLLEDQSSSLIGFKRPYSQAFIYLADEGFWENISLSPYSSYLTQNNKGGRDRHYSYATSKEKVDDKYPLLNGWYGGDYLYD